MSVIAYFTWNPKREIFMIPFLNIGVLWYSLFFATGVFLGYYIFRSFLKRYFFNFIPFDVKDFKNIDLFLGLWNVPEKENQRKVIEKIKGNGFSLQIGDNIKNVLNAVNSFFTEENFSLFIKSKKAKIHGVLDGKKALLKNIFEKTFFKCFSNVFIRQRKRLCL